MSHNYAWATNTCICHKASESECNAHWHDWVDLQGNRSSTPMNDIPKYNVCSIKGAQSRLNSLKSLAKLFNFVACNRCQSSPSLFLYGLLPVSSLWCFFIAVKYYFQVSFNLTVILLMLKITQNTVTEPL